jgi:hypothetical protein
MVKEISIFAWFSQWNMRLEKTWWDWAWLFSQVSHLNHSTNLQMVLTDKTSPFMSDNVVKIPPMLTLQIWDNDSFGPDDFLGTLSLNLSHFHRPASSSEKCRLDKSEKDYENIFARSGSIRGWWVCLEARWIDGCSEIVRSWTPEVDFFLLFHEKLVSISGFLWLENNLKEIQRQNKR